jgi:CDP-glycerol glycerophosphotransferase (TagB/SpsB family)
LGKCFKKFVDELHQDYVLIIRPHFNDQKNMRLVLEWKRRYGVEGVYIFHKQYQDIMEIVHIADLMIGDNSAVNYEFALIKNPWYS